jgi:hypothetical protein
LVLCRYWTNACKGCAIKHRCTTAKERRITRWEHEKVLEAVQRRLDEYPEKMRRRRETVEHPFGTIKARMGATDFLNLTRVMNIIGILPLSLTNPETLRSGSAERCDQRHRRAGQYRVRAGGRGKPLT